MKAKIIAVANEKGGIGKTTTVVNTAAVLVKKGYKVLVVDFDPQTHLTVSLGYTEPEELECTITKFVADITQHKEVEADEIKEAILTKHGIDLLPADHFLSLHEYAVKSITDGEYVLSDILNPLISLYDYILIDCMSSTGIYTINALVAANSVLIPSQPHYLSINGLQLILMAIKSVRKRLNPQLKIEGILVTMAQMNTKNSKKTIKTYKDDYSDQMKIFDTVIPLATAIAEAPEKGVSVIEYMKNNNGTIAYINFVEELIAHE